MRPVTLYSLVNTVKMIMIANGTKRFDEGDFMATNQHLDLSLINGYLDALDLEVLQQMLDLYAQQSQVYLTDIDEAITQEDQKLWQEHCHKMKGSAASAGLTQVYEKLIAIEKSTEQWSAKVKHLNILRLINQQAIDAFKQWLSSQ